MSTIGIGKGKDAIQVPHLVADTREWMDAGTLASKAFRDKPLLRRYALFVPGITRKEPTALSGFCLLC